MEKEQERELRKLLNVLRRMGRTARMYQWTGTKEEADAYSIDQYNRILSRLATLDSSAQDLFAPLPSEVTWGTLSNACRDLAAYYEDDAQGEHAPNETWWREGAWMDPRAYTKAKGPHGLPNEVQELGQFIREKIAEWQERKRGGEQAPPPRK